MHSRLNRLMQSRQERVGKQVREPPGRGRVADLITRCGSENKGGEDRKLVLGIEWPALYSNTHGQTENRDRVWQCKRLKILLRVAADQA